ncbi:MAG TPA: hypothetical protein VF544_11530 [Pyrinomonadaceae bacterium]
MADELFRRVIRQIPLRVKPLCGVANHHLRLVDGEHVEEDHHLAQVILSARAVAIEPIEAPMIAAGFPFRALSP